MDRVISMSKTPVANITHVTIFGNRNAGKSSLFNAMIGQDIAIVDNTLGTTTDPVHKRIELLPYGPILLTDTAGIDDVGSIGEKRVGKVRKMFAKTDLAIVVIDATSKEFDLAIEKELEEFKINYIKVFNKIDQINESKLLKLKNEYSEAIFLNTNDMKLIIDFKEFLINVLEVKKEKSIIGEYLPNGSNVVLVVPIDSEAPKGRLILPQVQVLRDLLDHNVNGIVTNENNLADILNSIDVDLVITDSQAFKTVSEIVPDNIYLTSFSILFAHQKADINSYSLVLPNNISSVLICESCTHNIGHEDIGYQKIPKLLRKRFKDIEIKHVMGNDFVENISNYDLVIHCGSCMLNDSVLKFRINLANKNNVPFTNYGLYLAYEAKILERSLQFFKDKNVLK